MNPSFQHALLRTGGFLARLNAAAEAHPRRAWWGAILLVLLVVGCETAYWPLNHYPGALWHKSPKGLDIEIPQEKAAHITWPELWSYWTGGQIEGNGYYRPLTSWLYVGEYRLFGTDDAAWSNLNILLHLGVAVALLWFVALIRPGPLLARLGTGALACLFFGGPGFADREVHFWTIGWWPAQPENISLLCTLGMLGSVVLYTRTGRRLYAVLLPALLVLGICFKEMTYVGGIGAGLLLVRQRKQWRLLAGFVGLIGALLLFRHLVLPAGQGLLLRPDHPTRFGNLAASQLMALRENFTWPDAVTLLAALVGTALIVQVSRRSWSRAAKVALGLALYVAVGVTVFDVHTFSVGARVLGEALFFVAVAVTLVRTAARWPVAELTLLYLGACVVVAGYPPYFGWYRLWPGVLASLLAALAWSEWLQKGWLCLSAKPCGRPLE